MIEGLVSGMPICIDGMQAGFLFFENGTPKEYVLYSVIEGKDPEFVRLCSRDQKNKLRKLVYHKRVVRSQLRGELLSTGKREYSLFFIR